MHGLLIHQAFVSPTEAGGTRHYELAQRLIAEQHEFTIVASDLSYLTGRKTIEHSGLVSVQNTDGVTVMRAYTYPAYHRSFFWRIISFLSFMLTSLLAALRAKQVDLVIGTSPPIFQAFSAWLVSAVRRRPFLLEVRDLWPEFAIDMGVLTNPLLIRVSRVLERFLYNRATHIVVNSPAYRDYMIQNKGLDPAKVSLIPNGVDPTQFNPAADGIAIRNKWDLGDKFVITYAGALGMANDIGTILRAAAQLQDQPDIHFLLVGDGKERGNLETLAEELQLSNVTFTGSVPKNLIPDVLAASDACTATLLDIPMFKTTYPNKVFDYMAAGRPTILGIDGVIREVLEAGNGGIFVQPGDHQALAEAATKLAQNRELAKKMGHTARNYVEANFNRQEHANQFLQLVQSLGQSN